VTNVPGTTRDVLEERLFIGSRDFVLLDTAGLRESDDLVERIGIERSKESMVAADVVCLLIDASLWQKGLNPSEVSKLILDEWTSAFSNVDLNSKCVVLVFSKKDLLSAREEEFQKSLRLAQAEFPFEAWKSVHVAVEECDELREALISAHEFKTGLKACKDAPMLISQRQRDKVLAASEDVREALVLLRQKDYPEKVASILNSAKISLEEIVGEISLDSVLDSVFSSFCIGK
jgi:tRNA modification GTPase